MSEVEALENSLTTDPTLTHPEQRNKWEQRIVALEKKVDDRKNVLIK